MNPFALISPAYAQDASGNVASLLPGAVPADVADRPGVLFPADPSAAAEAEGNAVNDAGVKRGDRVVTGGGILGTVQRVPMVQDKNGKQVASNEIEVEIAPNMRVTVLRDTITAVVKPTAAND